MPQDFPHFRSFLTGGFFAVAEAHARRYMAVVERRLRGERLSAEEIAAIKGPRLIPNGVLLRWTPNGLVAMDDDDGDRPRQSRDAAATMLVAGPAGASTAAGSAVGVIRVHGVISQHARQVDDVSGPGGTSCERVAHALRSALADPAIGSIVFDIDSPGGNVFGVESLAAEIHASRGRKPMVAQANSLMASAAYWIGSACDEIVVTPGGQVGSIGVVALHEDLSGAAEKAGVRFTFIHAGKRKVEGNSLEPLGDEARANIQADVDAYYRDFVRAVAKHRGVKVSDVTGGFGEAATVKDTQAVSEKMADRVATLDDTVRRLMSTNGRKSTRSRGASAGFTAAELDCPGGDAPPAATTEPEPTEPPQGDAELSQEQPAEPTGGDDTSDEPDAPQAPENRPDADALASDAWRRRRHAHLMRSAP